MKHLYAILLLVFSVAYFFLLKNNLSILEMGFEPETIAENFNKNYLYLNIFNYSASIILLVLTNLIFYKFHKGVYFFYTTLIVTTIFVLTQVISKEQFMIFQAEKGLSAGGYTWTKVYAFIAALIIIFLNGFNYFILYAIKKSKQGADVLEADNC